MTCIDDAEFLFIALLLIFIFSMTTLAFYAMGRLSAKKGER